MMDRTNYCAECEQHAREVARLQRIIKAWEDGLVRRELYDSGDWISCRYSVVAKRCKERGPSEHFDTPAEAYAALEVDDD